MPANFAEAEGSPTSSFSGGRFQGHRRFIIAWNDWSEFFTDLLGGIQNTPGGVVFSPAASFPGVAFTYVSEISTTPLGSGPPALRQTPLTQLSTLANRYDLMVVEATYQHWPPPENDAPQTPEGTILTYSANLSADYLTVPGRTWRWAGDDEPLPDDVNPGILLPTEDMQLSFMRVPFVPAAARTLRGKVNSGAFLGNPAGTVLFLGAAIQRTFQLVVPPNTPSLYQIDYHFQVKNITEDNSPRGWNHFYREGDFANNHWQVIVNQNGERPYGEADFSALFTV